MALDAEAGKAAANDVLDERLKVLESCGARFKRIVQEEIAIAFSNIDDFVSVAEGGELSFIPFAEITKKKLRAIKKIKETTKITESKDGEQLFKVSTIELDLWDKPAMLVNLHKLRGDYPNEKIDMNLHTNAPTYSDEEQAVLKQAALALARKAIEDGTPAIPEVCDGE